MFLVTFLTSHITFNKIFFLLAFPERRVYATTLENCIFLVLLRPVPGRTELSGYISLSNYTCNVVTLSVMHKKTNSVIYQYK